MHSHISKFGWLTTWLVASAAIAAPPSYTKDVAPILYENCASCHRPGEIGPFSVIDYSTVRPWAKTIKKVVHNRTMPPWHADSTKTEFLNDRSLTQEEIDTIVAWVDQGAKRGNPADLPPLPKFNDTWSMGRPDMIFTADSEFVVPPQQDKIEYQSLYFAPAVEEDLYIQAWEIRPSERGAVHHANLVRAPKKLPSVGIGGAVLQGGDYIGSYLPGARPFAYPEGTALKVPKGNIIQIQVHYVGLEEEVTDRPMFGVKLAQGRIDKVVRTVGTDEWQIAIEPNDGNWTMDSVVTLNHPLTIFSSGAHMHLRGSAYTAKAVFPDGSEQLIADVPRYDFNWQVNYELANPIAVPKGTKYHIHAVWDNSDKNPNNPDPSQKVIYGAWTENEMLTTWSHVVLTDEKLGLKVKDGRVVGQYDDAQVKPQPPVLQSFPATFTRPRSSNKSD